MDSGLSIYLALRQPFISFAVLADLDRVVVLVVLAALVVLVVLAALVVLVYLHSENPDLILLLPLGTYKTVPHLLSYPPKMTHIIHRP
jgi:hypothetical protein